MQPKFPSESVTTLTDLVLPGETNPLNNLFGGELIYYNKFGSNYQDIMIRF